MYIYSFILILMVFESFRDVKLTSNLDMFVIVLSFGFSSIIISFILVCRTFLWNVMLLKTEKGVIRRKVKGKRE